MADGPFRAKPDVRAERIGEAGKNGLKGCGKLRGSHARYVNGPLALRLDGRERRISPMQLLARFAKDESGATAIEYGLIAAGIALVIIPVVKGIGSTLNTKFTSINTQLR
jgi:pilus assembly protein Flp/PilA